MIVKKARVGVRVTGVVWKHSFSSLGDDCLASGLGFDAPPRPAPPRSHPTPLHFPSFSHFPIHPTLLHPFSLPTPPRSLAPCPASIYLIPLLSRLVPHHPAPPHPTPPYLTASPQGSPPHLTPQYPSLRPISRYPALPIPQPSPAPPRHHTSPSLS